MKLLLRSKIIFLIKVAGIYFGYALYMAFDLLPIELLVSCKDY